MDEKLVHCGDNMRDVAVTDGDKVEAQIRLGYDLYGSGVGDLVKLVDEANDAEVGQLVQAYLYEYDVVSELEPGGARNTAVCEDARIEIGLRNFLSAGNFKAFNGTFEDLHGLAQLPSLAMQRLIRDGYGFNAESDWKTSALVRAMKVMNVVHVIPTDAPLPKLPVGRTLWLPRPNPKVAAATWIFAGGAHHTGFSYSVTA